MYPQMFQVWFNTAFVESNYLCFDKSALDKACKVTVCVCLPLFCERVCVCVCCVTVCVLMCSPPPPVQDKANRYFHPMFKLEIFLDPVSAPHVEVHWKNHCNECVRVFVQVL